MRKEEQVSVIYITAVKMSGYGKGHEHIAQVRCVDEASGETYWRSREAVVNWLLSDKENSARVRDTADRRGWVKVRVVDDQPPYLQTRRDGIWQDNLLYLPGGPHGPKLDE